MRALQTMATGNLSRRLARCPHSCWASAWLQVRACCCLLASVMRRILNAV